MPALGEHSSDGYFGDLRDLYQGSDDGDRLEYQCENDYTALTISKVHVRDDETPLGLTMTCMNLNLRLRSNPLAPLELEVVGNADPCGLEYDLRADDLASDWFDRLDVKEIGEVVHVPADDRPVMSFHFALVLQKTVHHVIAKGRYGDLYRLLQVMLRKSKNPELAKYDEQITAYLESTPVEADSRASAEPAS